MMSSSENMPPPPTSDTGTRKQANQKGPPPDQPPLKCPRCDSANTKFCYYNNYSLTQPRHFCKTCRRYWTKGGALRNVPIGGGCRKTRKLKPSSITTSTSTTTSRLLSSLDPDFRPGFKFLSPSGNSSVANPTMEFQLGGLSLPRLHPATAGVYTQFVAGGTGAGCYGLDLMGLNSTSTLSGGVVVNTEENNQNNNISISSIESLSSINQEMHWKLQQQRLAFIYGNPTDGGDDHTNLHQNQKEKSPTIAMNLFRNLEVNNHGHNQKVMEAADARGSSFNGGDQPTEWFFDQNNNNNYDPNGNEIENGGVNLNGVQAAWGDLQRQFNGLQ